MGHVFLCLLNLLARAIPGRYVVVDPRVMEFMSQMTDQEWVEWHTGRGVMLAFRYAREEVGVMFDDPEIFMKFGKLFNKHLSEYWDKHGLPEDAWPGDTKSD